MKNMKPFNLKEARKEASDSFLSTHSARSLINQALDHIEELEEHCDTFCKCPSHGPSLVQGFGESKRKFSVFRTVRSILPMGNGELTAASCYRLHQKLEMALSNLGRNQQPDPIDSPSCERWDQERKVANEKIEAVARDIVMALTGKEIEFVDEV